MEFKIIDLGESVARVEAELNIGAIAAVETYPPLFAIAEDMMKVEEAVFSSQGRRGGGSWKRLKPATVKRKSSDRILFNTGELEASLTEMGGPGQVLNITRTEIEFGTEREGASSHQTGAPSKGIPARPFLRFLPTDYDRWNLMLTQHLLAAFSE